MVCAVNALKGIKCPLFVATKDLLVNKIKANETKIL